MGNCLKPVTISRLAYEEDKSEEAKLLVVSTLHDHQVALKGETSCKKRKKVRFKVQPDNAGDAATEATMTPPRKKTSVRVKVVLTQSELKQILNRATINHHHPPIPSPAPAPSSVDQISGQILVKCKKSRSVMCKCRCSWNPVLHAIPE